MSANEQCPFCNSLNTTRIEDIDNFEVHKCNYCSKEYNMEMIF